MEKVIEDIIKIIDTEKLNEKDKEFIEVYISQLKNRFSLITTLQNSVMTDEEKFKSFAMLVDKYLEDKNG